MKIVYSLPVHERVDVVINTIENIKKYSPSACIVLHVNPEFIDFDCAEFAKYDCVYINPERHSFSWGESLLNIHHSNYRYAKSVIEEFTHICLFASNQMFICHGFESHVRYYASGVQILPLPSWYKDSLIKNELFTAFMKKANLRRIYKGHWEGAFFTSDLFEKIDAEISDFFLVDGLAMHLEEFVYPMLVAKHGKGSQIASPGCYMDIGLHRGLLPLNIELIDAIITRSKNLKLSGPIRASKLDNLMRILSGKTQIYRNINDLFMVKRVARDMRDPFRQYINSL